jgi:hypothetical protein
VCEAKCALKAAGRTSENCSAAIARIVANAGDDVHAQMPSKDAMRKVMGRERRKFIPPLPRELSDLCLTEEWRETTSGQLWLKDVPVIDTETEKRMLIFCAPRSLHLLASAEVWYADGTFSVTPPFFMQVSVFLVIIISSRSPPPLSFVSSTHCMFPSWGRLFHLPSSYCLIREKQLTSSCLKRSRQ